MTWDDLQDRYRQAWEATLRISGDDRVAVFQAARKAGTWSGGATRARQAIAPAALRMRNRGLTYAQIAKQLGVPRHVVTLAIKEAAA